MLSFFIKDKFLASPCFTNILGFVLELKLRFVLEIVIEFLLISTPIELRFRSFDSTNVVPLPTN